MWEQFFNYLQQRLVFKKNKVHGYLLVPYLMSFICSTVPSRTPHYISSACLLIPFRLWCFFRLTLFLMTLTLTVWEVLLVKCFVECLPHCWNLSDVFLTIRPGLWVIGHKTTEVCACGQQGPGPWQESGILAEMGGEMSRQSSKWRLVCIISFPRLRGFDSYFSCIYSLAVVQLC